MILSTVVFFLLILLFIFVLILIFKNKNKSVDNYKKFWDPKINILKEKLSMVIPNIDQLDINGSNKSFTINKKHIHLCLKNSDGDYYDDNMLIYVLLHEIAHVMCDEVGHTDKFRQIFSELLEKAAIENVYNPNIPPEDNYCEYYKNNLITTNLK